MPQVQVLSPRPRKKGVSTKVLIPFSVICTTFQDLKASVKKTVRWTVFSESVDDTMTMNKPQQAR
ncbi:MAG: hypothetical protein EGR46_09000 [Ruminococcus sp.]|nr:hypothetical protein [Ruminococcus sp.]